jgi:hypothetical protein
MRLVRVAWVFIALFFLTWGWILWKAPQGAAQEQVPSPLASAVPAELDAIIRKQFGPCFEIATERANTTGVKYLHPKAATPWVPFLTADLDGDGVEDAVIVARCKTPLADEVAYSYKVLDPYYSNYGYGNPKITAQFNAQDPDHQNLVLVIHGAGNEAWRAATPKAKFVFINLPFDTISLSRIMHRKHPVPAVSLLEEQQQLSSAVYWDGKKWRWADTGAGTP